jgi:hypothetical protein
LLKFKDKRQSFRSISYGIISSSSWRLLLPLLQRNLLPPNLPDLLRQYIVSAIEFRLLLILNLAKLGVPIVVDVHLELVLHVQLSDLILPNVFLCG